MGKTLLGPDGGDDLAIGVEPDTEPPLVSVGDGLAQVGQPARRRVAVVARAPGSLRQLLHRHVGRRDVRVAEPEIDDVVAPAPGLDLQLVHPCKDIRRNAVDAPKLHGGDRTAKGATQRTRPSGPPWGAFHAPEFAKRTQTNRIPSGSRGGAGNRTPVRPCIHAGISERSRQQAFGRPGLCQQAARRPIPSCLGPPVRESRRLHPAKRRPAPGVQEPPGRTGYLIRQPVRSCLRHLLVVPAL